jgi:hypothetical protein
LKIKQEQWWSWTRSRGMCGICNARSSMWGELPCCGGTCGRIWHWEVVFCGVVWIVSVRATWKGSTWWISGSGVSPATYFAFLCPPPLSYLITLVFLACFINFLSCQFWSLYIWFFLFFHCFFNWIIFSIKSFNI